MAAFADQPEAMPIGSMPIGVVPAEWPGRGLCCDACEQTVPVRGCRRYGRYTLCPRCGAEYLTAWAMGRRMSPGQYIRDKRFGEDEAYTLRAES